MDLKKAYRGAMTALRTSHRDLGQATLHLLRLQAKYDKLSSTDPVLAQIIDENERLANLNAELEAEGHNLLDQLKYEERVQDALRKRTAQTQREAKMYRAWAIACAVGFITQGVGVLVYLSWLG